jgi:hypothetical protein
MLMFTGHRPVMDQPKMNKFSQAVQAQARGTSIKAGGIENHFSHSEDLETC